MSEKIEEELVLTLRKPIEMGGITYTKLDLREPTAEELAQWDKVSGTDGDILALSIVSGVPKSVVGKIGARDLIKGARFIAGFLS